MVAAERFAVGEPSSVIPKELRVSELLQRCRSRVRMALAIDVMRLGLHRTCGRFARTSALQRHV
jgi:hypothetical protein